VAIKYSLAGSVPPPESSSKTPSPALQIPPITSEAASESTDALPPPPPQPSLPPPSNSKDQAKRGWSNEGSKKSVAEEDIDALIEEEKRTLSALLTEEFNQKCEKYYALFQEKDAVVQQQIASLARIERDLQDAHLRQAHLETSFKQESARCHLLEETLRQKEEELIRANAEIEQWRGKDARFAGREFDR